MKLWTTLEERKLRELFPVYKTMDVAKMMGRSYRSIRDKAYDLKLKKEFDFSDYFLPGNKVQPFKKGQCGKGCEKTWFKKGDRIHVSPIGSEVFRWNCVFVKVTDNVVEGDNRHRFLANWKRKKYVVWEAVNGPVPEGFFLTHRDGNQKNCELENLVLVTRKDLSKYANRDKKKWSEAAKRRWEKHRAEMRA